MKTKMTLKNHTQILQNCAGTYSAYVWSGDPEKPGCGYFGHWHGHGEFDTIREAREYLRDFLAASRGRLAAE